MNVAIRRLVTVFMVLPLIFTSGCWSANEINDRAFVTIVLVDLTENGETELTLGFPLPNRMIPGMAGGGGSAKGDPFTFVTKQAKNLNEALALLEIDLPRTITFGQTQTIVVSEKYAQQSITSLLEFVERQPTFHLSANLFVVPDKVVDIKRTPMVFEQFISIILTKYVRHHYTLDTTVKDVIASEYKGGDILIPMLSFKIQPEIELDNPKKNRWMGVDGAAIISGNKMVSTISKENLRGALWLSSQIDNSMITVQSPSDGKDISCFTQNVSTNIKPVVQDGKVSFSIKSKADAFVVQSESTIDLSEGDMLLKIQQKLNDTVKSNMEDVIRRTKEFKSDAFLLSYYLDWRYPKTWEKLKTRWRDYYSTSLDVDISVNIDLDRTGGNYRSVQLEKTNEKGY